MGESDKPLAKYSTSEMAKDVIELLDQLGWKAERELHVVGISMGGMIAQELVDRLLPTALYLCTDALRLIWNRRDWLPFHWSPQQLSFVTLSYAFRDDQLLDELSV